MYAQHCVCMNVCISDGTVTLLKKNKNGNQKTQISKDCVGNHENYISHVWSVDIVSSIRLEIFPVIL